MPATLRSPLVQRRRPALIRGEAPDFAALQRGRRMMDDEMTPNAVMAKRTMRIFRHSDFCHSFVIGHSTSVILFEICIWVFRGHKRQRYSHGSVSFAFAFKKTEKQCCHPFTDSDTTAVPLSDH